ncbi:hypothetical protein HMN09_00850600 [Mycena chlorophos]|uniref:Uncharacterized protein n=1 Tax=Mycena chlorophos TaxID=658473 RepID=A0A8H6SRE8_MYCCL|nr:hypothetical protein HMN09_00850600 [Mycena chlorophos]
MFFHLPHPACHPRIPEARWVCGFLCMSSTERPSSRRSAVLADRDGHPKSPPRAMLQYVPDRDRPFVQTILFRTSATAVVATGLPKYDLFLPPFRAASAWWRFVEEPIYKPLRLNPLEYASGCGRTLTLVLSLRTIPYSESRAGIRCKKHMQDARTLA